MVMRFAWTGPAVAVALLFSAFAPVAGQGAALPRLPDGKPNLQGIWQALTPASYDIQDHHAHLGIAPGQGIVEGNDIPYQPWALAKRRENFEKRATLDPESKGYLPGIPRIMYMPFPFQISQTRDYLTMLFEYDSAVRIVYTNSSAHPRGPIPWWMGDSRGHWEGDTLVVDAIHFTNETRFERAGNFHSNALHLVERYTLLGPDHLNYEVTIEDPNVLTRPWKMQFPLYRRKETNVRLLEYVPPFLMQEQEAEREGQKP